MAASVAATGIPEREPRRWRLPVAPTLTVVGAISGAAWCAGRPGEGSSVLLLGVWATAATVGICWAWWRGRREGAGLWGVLAVAAVLRLVALPLGPSLSDDGYRYVWDGKVQAEGINPYRYRPNDHALDALRDGFPFERMNSEGYFSVYPPASQIVFVTATWLAGPDASWAVTWWVIKLLLVALEALAIVLLARLVEGHALLLYAWHPLAVLEIAGQGHTEAAMLPALAAAALALSGKAPRARARVTAGAALAWATMVKLVPIVLAPFALRKGRGLAVVAGAVVGMSLSAPYAAWFVIPHVRESLDLYVRYFEFNAGPYFALKELGRWWTGGDVSKTLGPTLRGAFVVGLLPIWAVAWWKRWAFAPAALLGWAWFFFTATTVHPWYLLGPLVLVPVVEGRPGHRGIVAAWVVLAAGSIWTYAFYGGYIGLYWTSVIAFWSIWTALMTTSYASAALSVILVERGCRKWRWFASLVSRNAPIREVLDLGAGEGFVGSAARADVNASVELCDVTDFNRTDLPHTTYDGQTLPYADDRFDLVLLTFVLHHARNAERVLSEAHRVVRPGGQVAVMESVAETGRDEWLLHLLDPLANRVRSGGLMVEQEEHLAFRSTLAWRGVFESAGFQVVRESRRGRLIHKRHVFILSKPT